MFQTSVYHKKREDGSLIAGEFPREMSCSALRAPQPNLFLYPTHILTMQFSNAAKLMTTLAALGVFVKNLQQAPFPIYRPVQVSCSTMMHPACTLPFPYSATENVPGEVFRLHKSLLEVRLLNNVTPFAQNIPAMFYNIPLEGMLLALVLVYVADDLDEIIRDFKILFPWAKGCSKLFRC
jgi:hypothetical protein